MISPEERAAIEAMTDDELAVAWVVTASSFRRFAWRVETLGSAGTTGVRPTDARDLIRGYLELDARLDLLDDLVRERLAP